MGSIYSYDDSSNVTHYPCAKYNYKYDTATGTYTRLTDIPYKFYCGSAVSVGTDIYLLGNLINDYNDYNYKYDTTTDTYTQNRDIPYYFDHGSAVSIGTDIYLLGSSVNDYAYNNYKYNYDIITSTSIYIKPSNHSIYTSNNKSYTNKDASFIYIENDEYYTEYDSNNNIVNNTYPISSDGITRFYIKPGAILNGKEVPCESEGWVDINILDYM